MVSDPAIQKLRQPILENDYLKNKVVDVFLGPKYRSVNISVKNQNRTQTECEITLFNDDELILPTNNCNLDPKYKNITNIDSLKEWQQFCCDRGTKPLTALALSYNPLENKIIKYIDDVEDKSESLILMD